MTDENTINRCAAIADETVAELEALLTAPGVRRRSDKQTALQIRYAIRWCKRIAVRIRAQLPPPWEEEQSIKPSSNPSKQA